MLPPSPSEMLSPHGAGRHPGLSGSKRKVEPLTSLLSPSHGALGMEDLRVGMAAMGSPGGGSRSSSGNLSMPAIPRSHSTSGAYSGGGCSRPLRGRSALPPGRSLDASHPYPESPGMAHHGGPHGPDGGVVGVRNPIPRVQSWSGGLPEPPEEREKAGHTRSASFYGEGMGGDKV